eukprot:TRINITY_DN8217_c0_g2_i3.p1 TRINITY_DN8217_c0_g2~~TRINITY_DN8217_c0_g2_i3.p1  ORF type:complete len:102 (+),score=10.58 TRINITY_DN8217_c0_g2_i3:563-868(+)
MCVGGDSRNKMVLIKREKYQNQDLLWEEIDVTEMVLVREVTKNNHTFVFNIEITILPSDAISFIHSKFLQSSLNTLPPSRSGVVNDFWEKRDRVGFFVIFV